MTPVRVLDKNLSELHPGDRVRFVDTFAYINATTGSGIVREIDQYGGVTIDTDAEMLKADRHGNLQRQRWWYFCARYDYDQKAHVARHTVGDPYEHVPVACWIEKAEAAP